MHVNHFFQTFIMSIFLLVSINCNAISAEISCGELVDKITILTIKSKRIADSEKLKNIFIELEALQKIFTQFIEKNSNIEQLQELLQATNQLLWDVEDAIRIKERNKEFDDEFIELARSVYLINDKRYIIKKNIDQILGSYITEEKSYKEII